MELYSTNGKSEIVEFREAVLEGLASDGGLFMPRKIPVMSPDFFKHLDSMSLQEISFEVARTLLGGNIPVSALKDIVDSALNFDVPLIHIEDNRYILELFHGPTLAFKDVGARFMARVVSHFAKGPGKELTILVATSGDTGSAVAQGFYNLSGIRVVILYPQSKVSELQEKQLTTVGGNVTALEVEGTFDDCQGMVKEAFQDTSLNGKLSLTSANSINIARLLPQAFYYFYAYAQALKAQPEIRDSRKPLVFSVPSGNFGNLTAGLIAKRMGLPINHFIATTNVNDVVPEYLTGGEFRPRPSKQTISNAMDVGNPSNFDRMLELYNHDIQRMRADITGYSFTDDETRNAIREVYEQDRYIMDPHTAVGNLGLRRYQQSHPDALGISLSTAHPAKFGSIVEPLIGEEIELPQALKESLGREKRSIVVPNSYEALRTFLSSGV